MRCEGEERKGRRGMDWHKGKEGGRVVEESFERVYLWS